MDDMPMLIERYREQMRECIESMDRRLQAATSKTRPDAGFLAGWTVEVSLATACAWC